MVIVGINDIPERMTMYIYIYMKNIFLVIDVESENNIFVKTIILFLSDLGWCEKQYIENIHVLILFWGF